MKKISFKLFAAASSIALAIGGAGCAKIDEFGNTNSNPNAVTSPVTSALLTNAESNLGSSFVGGAFSASLVNGLRGIAYCQHVSETQYTDLSLYSLPQVESAGTYSGPMMDLQVIINRNSDPTTAPAAAAYGSNANQIAVAKILKSYYIWTITDRWGDVPYSQALQGQSNFAPAYDLQEDIYKAMFKDLKDAINGFDAGAPVKGDLFYNGDNAKWKKLANSLRMLMAMRLTKVYPNAGQLAATEYADAYGNAAGYISTNSDNLVLPYPGGVYRHPWYETYFTRDDYALSKTMGDCLNGLGDTRLSVFGTPGPTFPYGLTRDLAVAYTSSVGNNQSRVLAASKRAENSPVVIVNASSVLLSVAEAVERGWVAGNSETAYNSGVTASFGEWGLAVPANYLTTGAANFQTGNGVPAIGQNPAPYDAIPAAQNAVTNTRLKRIQLQRWLACFPNGNEGWAEWRRTGIPDLRPTRFATNAGGQIPRRLVYGTSEYSVNPTQVAAAVARLAGGDTQDSRVWWDKP